MMVGNIASQSKALWAIGLGVAGAIGVGTFVKTDSGEPLATALVSEINKTIAKPTKETAATTDPNKPEIKITKQASNDTKKTVVGNAEKQNEAEPKKHAEENKIASLNVPITPQVAPTIKLEKDKEMMETATPPSIDLLRVSPDGGVVIAGRAMPNAKVFVFNGDTKIADTKSTATGDYVIVLDEPLKDGEHELIIKAGKVEADMLNSLTSGVIILPKNKKDMIVLLSKLGEASKILQMPSDRFGPKSQKTASLKGKPSSIETPNSIKQDSESLVAVNAVDVEEERYYVAGAATPKSTVNVYIDNVFKGKAITGEEGAYLYYGRESISAGKHALRVDMLAGDNVTVVARAEVVLEHEVEANSTMAMNETATNKNTLKEGSLSIKETDTALDPNAAISSGSSGKRIADIGNAPANKVESAKAMSAKMTAKKDMALDPNAAISSGSSGKRIANIGPAPAIKIETEKTMAAKMAVKKNMAVDPNAAISSGSSGKRIANIGNVPAIKIETTKNGELLSTLAMPRFEAGKRIIKSGSSVIIRRGDSLWRVSRRKFGLGRKYTVIFTANRDQIQDPHRIYPGQVLKVPENADSVQ